MANGQLDEFGNPYVLDQPQVPIEQIQPEISLDTAQEVDEFGNPYASELTAPPPETPFTMSNMDKFAIQGITGHEIDMESGGDFLTRFDMSFSDTDTEKAWKFMDYHPEGALKRVSIPEIGKSFLIFKYDIDNKDEKWKTVEDEGWGLRDFADVAGGAPEFIGSTAPWLLPGFREAGLLTQMLSSGLGAFIGHMGKEIVETARGYQSQGFEDVLYDAGGRAGITSLMVGGAGGGAKLAKKLTTGGPLPQWQREVFDLISGNPELAKHFPLGVLAPDRKIINRLMQQATSTSKHGQQFLKDAQDAAVKELEKIVGPDDFIALGKEVRKEMVNRLALAKIYAMSGMKDIGTEKAGKTLTSAFADDFVSISSKTGGKLYNLVDDAASREKPEFDFTSLIKESKKVKEGVIGAGREQKVGTTTGRDFRGALQGQKPSVKAVDIIGQPGIKVDDTPLGQFKSVLDDIGRLDPKQTNYEVVKNLRTRLNNLINNEAWGWDENKHAAARFYRQLSDVLKNPTNDAPTYKKLINNASAYWSQRVNALELKSVRSIIKDEKPVQLAKRMSGEGEWTKEIDDIASRFSPAKTKEVKSAIQLYWIKDNPGKSVAKLSRMKSVDPEGYRRIVGDINGPNDFALKRMAMTMDKINSSRMQRVLETDANAGKVVKNLIDNQDVEGIQYLVKQFGGKDSKGVKSMKAGILENMLHESTEISDNFIVVNPQKFAAIWREYDRNGILKEIFTQEDRKGLLMIKAYTQLWKRKADPGVSLEAAQLISLLKHPDTVIQGAHGLGVNELMARILLSPRTRDLAIKYGNRPTTVPTLKIMSVALEDAISYSDASMKESIPYEE